VPLVAFTLVSFRTLVKLNWLVVAYWPLVILGVRRVLEKARGERELRLGLGSSAAIVIVALVLMAIPNAPLGAGNSWSGWDRAAARVHALQAELEARGERSFVFAPNHKVSSMLWFHRAGQPRTYAQDILGENALQYDFLPPPPPLAGATGILVTDDHGGSGFDPYAVTRHFQSIKHAETIEIRGIGGHVRRIDIWLLGNYAGYPRVKDGAAAPSKAP
jgi:hypothetical protein